MRDGRQTLAAIDAADVRFHLTSDMWVRIETVAETGSTNDDAIGLARSGAPHATAVLASRQTRGRGRLGRSWESPAGGIYISAIVRPQLPAADLTALPVAVAVGVAHTISRLVGDARVKWPNDVLLPGGKVAGVLLELGTSRGSTEWVVIGVGLNVRRPGDGFVDGAAYLADQVPDITCEQAAAAVLDGIAEGFQLHVGGGGSAVREALEGCDALLGCEVSVHEADGSCVTRGRAAGIDDAGRLLVEGADGSISAIASGDVTLRHVDSEQRSSRQ